MTDIIIGFGEVGKALVQVLGERTDIAIHDPQKGYEAKRERTLYDENTPYPASVPIEYDWMHIAYPWHKEFVTTTLFYWLEFLPKHVVIHSTVPVGTMSQTVSGLEQPDARASITYSPVRGIHPNIARYLREFPKWYATTDKDEAKAVEDLFHSCGMQPRRAPSFECLETMKLYETTEYGYRIALWQEIERQMAKYETRGGASFEEAMTAMKEWLFEKRKVYDGDRGLAPIMYGGVIGGHCVVPNWELLRQSGMMSPQLYRWLKESNEMRKTELQG